MGTVYFIGDLHLQHNNIIKFAGEYRNNPATIEEHDDWIIDQINSTINRRDILYILGDVAFSRVGLHRLGGIRNNNMYLVRGNHDKFPTTEYLMYFREIYGILSYKHMWLSHAPIHPAELRGRPCVHGHVHHHTLPDKNYINVSVEALGGIPISLDTIRDRIDGHT